MDVAESPGVGGNRRSSKTLWLDFPMAPGQQRELTVLHFCFLETEDIGLLALEPLQHDGEAFAE